MRLQSRILSIIALALVAPLERPARGDEPAPALLVVALPEGVCTIDGATEGPSPLLARIAAGSHDVACRREVSGVVVRRAVRVTTNASSPTRVVVDLRGAP